MKKIVSETVDKENKKPETKHKKMNSMSVSSSTNDMQEGSKFKSKVISALNTYSLRLGCDEYKFNPSNPMDLDIEENIP